MGVWDGNKSKSSAPKATRPSLSMDDPGRHIKLEWWWSMGDMGGMGEVAYREAIVNLERVRTGSSEGLALHGDGEGRHATRMAANL